MAASANSMVTQPSVLAMECAVTSQSPPDMAAAPRLSAEAKAPAVCPSKDWAARLLAREGEGILRMLWRLLGCEADVLDAYQDCFCKLAMLTARPGNAQARAYAFRTAANIALDLLRMRKRHDAHWPDVVATRQTNGSEAAHPSTDGRVELLRGAIAALSPHLRSVIVLRDIGRMSYEQVGRTLGIDPATARVYRRHAIVKLTELLHGAEP